MPEPMHEKISALMDGELSEADLRPTLEELERDPELMLCWQRYHLMSDALKSNLPSNISHDLASRVSRAIESEPPHQLQAAPKRRRTKTAPAYVRPAAGFALAASVAAVGYLGLMWEQQQPGGVTAGMAPVASVQPLQPVPVEGVQSVRLDAEQPAMESKLYKYVVNHNEYSGVGIHQGMMPYVRIVGYEQRQQP